ncbi:MAG: response regulator [Opitutaceae bacterium]|nr:response regulator [Opitutaceae bacterium]
MTESLSPSESAPAPRILLVDDTPANLALLVDALHASGYRPLVAATGEAALERLGQVRPDLILLDMRMPGLSGMETIARIQAHVQWREIPVIFMTAVEEPEQKVQAFSAGAVDYVTKPFDTREVLARIETHLRLKALQRALADELAWRAETERALRDSLEQAVVVAGRDGRLQFCTLRAGQLLERYCPGGDGRLPEALSTLVDAGRSTRLRIAGPQGELDVRLVADPTGDAPATLLLEEHRAPGDFAPLRTLGLSEREAEVLFWISQGKTNPEIGVIIGAASGTVKKHAENIFAKLGVEGRASAMRMALDALRM